MRENFHPTTGAIFLRPVGDLPKKTVGKRFGLTSFLVALIPIVWYSLFLVVGFLGEFAPPQTGMIYLSRFIWYTGLFIIPVFCLMGIVIGVLSIMRPAISGKVWALATFLICALTVLSFLLGFLPLRP